MTSAAKSFSRILHKNLKCRLWRRQSSSAFPDIPPFPTFGDIPPLSDFRIALFGNTEFPEIPYIPSFRLLLSSYYLNCPFSHNSSPPFPHLLPLRLVVSAPKGLVFSRCGAWSIRDYFQAFAAGPPRHHPYRSL